MADITVHGVPAPESGVTTIESISTIIYAKYVSIQKGATRHTIKGIVYIAENQNANGSAIYFAYRDSEGAGGHGQSTLLNYDVVMLEDLVSWTDFTMDTLREYDITSKGKYIYFVASGDTSSTITNYDKKEPPYNKAYFWDWKINAWDKFVAGFDGRFMGLMPMRLLATPINEDTRSTLARGVAGATTASNTTIDLTGDTPNLSGVAASDIITIAGTTSGMSWSETLTIASKDDGADTVVVTVAPQSTATNVVWSIKSGSTTDSEDSMSFEVDGGHTPWEMPVGHYTGGIELVSSKHGLRSYLRMRTRFALGSESSGLRYFVDELVLPSAVGAETNQVRGSVNGSPGTSCMLHWGIPHVDGYRVWRTQGDAAASGLNLDKYSPVGPLYMVNEYLPKGFYDENSGFHQVRLDHAPVEYRSSENGPDTTYYTDTGLVTQTKFDAIEEAFGPAPRMKRIAQYNGLLVGITDIAEPSSLEDDWDEADQRTEELCWSHTGKLEPENFPTENRYPPEDSGEKFLSLEQAGDHLFAISNGSVYQITRTGSPLALTRVLSRLGGVSRYAATGVGNVLFIVTKSGVKSIDGNTRAVKSISAMDRIIVSDREWAQSLGAVSLEYDATLGALIFFNTTKDECFILWESTGAVTRLKDCPWSFMVGGEDVLTDGPQRAYFIDDAGVVTCIDAAREMGKRSMCGTGAGETVNGTCTTGSSTQIIDTAAVFPVNCVGHQVYIHNGDMEGDSVEITVRNSDTTITVSGLSESTATTTRYSVAPIVTELVMSQLDVEKGIDPFVRKIATAMSAAFSDLGGETGSSDTNAYIRMGLWRNRQRLTEVEVTLNILPDKCVAKTDVGDVRVYPSLRFLGGNMDFELQGLLIHGVLGISEAQSRQA
jgi:hypothetical protein